MKKIFFLSMAALSLTITGCLKDSDFDDNETGFKTDNKDRLLTVLNAYETRGMHVESIFPAPAEDNMEAFTLALTGPVYDKDVQVTLAVMPDLVADHNAEENDNFEVLPASAYVLPTTVTIPAGSAYAIVPITVKKGPMDQTKAYGLGVQVTAVSDPAIKIASNTRQSLLGILIRNIYDGIYEMRAVTGHPTNPALAGPVGPVEVSLITDGPSSVVTGATHRWANGSNSALPAGYNAIFNVDAGTNDVTVTDGNAIGFVNAPGYPTRYDPATRTFYAKWQYAGAGGNRVFTDTLVYLRAR